MFHKKCINFYHYYFRFRMLSQIPVSQKNFYSSITAAFHRLHDDLPCRQYCMESNKATYSDPNSLISQEYEVPESLNDLPSAVHSKVKYRNYKDRCIQRIKTAFKCSDSESLTLYQQYPYLFHEDISGIMKKVTMMTNSGISEKSIFKNIDILELSDDEIAYKLEQLDTWGLNNEQKGDVLALMKLKSYLFVKITVQFQREAHLIHERNRLIYISRILECTLEKAADLSMKYEDLLRQSFERIKETFELLLDNGISPQCLQNNLWFTVNNLENIKKWLNSPNAKSTSCSKVNNNFIFFQKLIEKEKNERTFLKPNQSRDEFFAEKLQVDVNVIRYLVTNFPKIFNQDLCRLTKVIDFLYSHGYTGNQICANPSILNKDIELLQNRLKECQSLHCDIIPLCILCGSKSKFNVYLKNWTSDPS